ncbi:MAG: SurA N-terminal domain-containing protein [Bacteroidales bacterium]|nr:SurA N-terminal domain-containing protein [Bacteroidales bacterium]
MSVLQTMREKAGTLLAVVIGLSLLGFILGDFLGSGGNMAKAQQKYYEIATIDGEKFYYQEFEEKVQNLSEIYKMSVNTTLTEEMIESIREQVWEKMVEEQILGAQISKLGIGVSPEEIESMVFGNNPHPIVQQLFANPETGMVDRSFLVNFLKTTEYDPQAKAYWLFFEDEIVSTKINAKLSTLISKGLYVTGRQAEYEMGLNSNSVDFSYIVKSYGTVPDSSVTVSATDIEKYYNSHREDYRQAASRDMEYVEFQVLPSEDDVRETEEGITGEIEEFAAAANPVQFINLSADTRHFEFYQKLEDIPEVLADFVAAEDLNTVYGPYVEDDTYKIARIIDIASRPDSVHARHILIAPNQGRSMAQSKEVADSLMRSIEAGASFEAIAFKVSDDQGSAQLGGDLGWFEEGMMVTPFNNACFENSKGDLVLAETTYGYHIIEILDQSRKVKKYHIGIIDRAIEPSSDTYQRIYSDASRFAGNNNTYEKFNQAVAEENLNKRIATGVTPEQKDLPGLESPRTLVMSLFEAKPNSIILDRSEQAIFELADKYVVAYCTTIREEGIAPLREVENEIRYILINDKKAEKIIADMKSVTAGLDNINAIASAMNLQVQEATGITFSSFSVPGAGIEPAVIATATNLSEGSVSSPVKGNNGVFILAVNSVTTNSQAQNIELLRSRLLSNYQMRASFESIEAVKEMSEIEDKRYKFY